MSVNMDKIIHAILKYNDEWVHVMAPKKRRKGSYLSILSAFFFSRFLT